MPLVRLAAPIEPEWLLERATERISLEWNRTAERVEQVTALVYDQLVIEETRAPAAPSEEASRLLAQKALEAGIGRFADRDALEQLRSRAAFGGITIDVGRGAGGAVPRAEPRLRELEAADILGCDAPGAHRSSRAGASQASRRPRGQGSLRTRQAAVDRIATSGFLRHARDAAIGGAPVVVHLLAPNHRPVQVTSDLAGFWERLYPQVRKELSRRYPKHKWPEKPV